MLDRSAAEACSFAEAQIREADFGGISLVATDFSRAQIESSDLSHARLNDANFNGAHLRYVDLHAITETNAIWSGCTKHDVDGTDEALLSAENWVCKSI